MLTTKNALAIVAAACLLLTGCAPPGIRALRKGDRLVQSGKYSEAIEALTRATNLLGKDALAPQAKAHNLLGLAYHHTGNAAGARACYEKALDLDRSAVVEADYNLGCLELEQNNLADARDALTTYTTKRAQDWNGFMKLGAVNYRLAMRSASDSARQLNFDNARKAFDAARHLKATAEAWNNLAMIDLLRRPAPARAVISNAVVEFKAALACDTNYAPALFNLALIYDPGGLYKFGDVQTATNAYRHYLALAPPPPHAGEIALLLSNLNATGRMTVTRPGQQPEQPDTLITPSTNTNRMIVIARTNPPPRATTPPAPPPPGPPPPPAPAASNPPLVVAVHTSNPPVVVAVPASNRPPLVVSVASNPPVVAVPPPSNPPPVVRVPASNPLVVAAVPPPRPPEEPSPPRPARAGSASNPAVLPPGGGAAPAISNTAAAPTNLAAPTNIASATNLAAPTNIATASSNVSNPSWLARLFGGKPKPAATNVGTALHVTPLPPPRGDVRYAAPPMTTNAGNRAEADRLVKEGAAAERESGAKAALAGYGEAVKADPSDYEACEALGTAALKSEDYAIALEAMRHALALQPQSVNARYGFARALEKEDYFQDAANELEKLLAQHPDETRAHLLLGDLYAQELGQPDLARGHYKKVLEKDPANPQAPTLRAWLKNNPGP
jgi:tetratricopeptide (TPR) repeat protein